ncbi:Clp protease [Clostridium sartagoforme AAU1]|uniref:ATP-dependent Clp protease proteolytic subunit n=1 Tax=Clostridium sartagoforme AAU1 TaxID=1202534 RepID=R9BTX0_9CLOT|nr:head maturation protease, ClpP-related [Clostridium sartagoforme]EOR20589.1 Clp protease [Clostridium sartagoforme AAU1]
MSKKYWEFKNKTSTEADLYLYIQIASWGGGYAAHSAQSFKQELDNLGEIDTLNIYINSPGGDVFEGNTIMNMLKRKKYTKNVYVDGLAASIASVIAMAGDKIIMPSNAMMMIHNAWVYTAGNSNELRKLADDLDKVNASIRQTYLDKAGDKLDEETITTLMDNETWLTAQECFDYGLCDVVGEDKSIEAKFDLSLLNKYKNIPVDYVLKQATAKNNKHEEINNIENEKKAILEELELI